MPNEEKKERFGKGLLWKVWSLIGLYWFFVFQFVDALPYAVAYFLTEFGFYMMWIVALFSIALFGLPWIKRAYLIGIKKIREVGK